MYTCELIVKGVYMVGYKVREEEPFKEVNLS